MSDEKPLIKFYENIFYGSLKDREIIQSKLKLHLYAIISFLTYIYFFIKVQNKIVWIDVFNKILIVLILALSIAAVILLYKVFSMQNYQEMPDPLDIEEQRSSLPKEDQEEKINSYIIHLYSKAASVNIKLNEKRRKDINILVNVLFITSAIVFIDFIIIMLPKLFGN